MFEQLGVGLCDPDDADPRAAERPVAPQAAV